MSKSSLSLAIALSAALVLLGCPSAPKSVNSGLSSNAGALTVKPGKEVPVEQVGKLLEQDKLAEAASAMKKLAEEKKAEPGYKLLYASILLSEGKLAESEAVLQEQLVTNPSDSEALFIMSAIESAKGNEPKRKEYLDKTLASKPDHAGALAEYGEIWADAEVYVKAEESFRKALASEPRNSSALLGLGRLYYRDRKNANAESMQTKALEINPSLSIGWAERARTRYQSGRYDEAMADMDQALKLEPENAWYYLERARIGIGSGKRDKCLSDLGRAIELEPSYFLPYIYRAGMHEEEGRDKDALADYKALVNLKPDYFYAFESIGILSMKFADWEGAQKAFEAAYNASPQEFDYAVFTAICYYRQGKLKEGQAFAATVHPRMDREKEAGTYQMLRLFHQPADTTEAELKIMADKRLDHRALTLYFLAHYWQVRGKIDLARKYHIAVRDMNRKGTIADRVNEIELSRLGAE